jgi:hypothetical protein
MQTGQGFSEKHLFSCFFTLDNSHFFIRQKQPKKQKKAVIHVESAFGMILDAKYFDETYRF